MKMAISRIKKKAAVKREKFIKQKVFIKREVLMRKVSLMILACLFMTICSGCKNIKIEEAKREQLEYTVIQQDDVPETIKSLIEKRKVKEFQLTYKSGDELYLFKGYGQQMTGGYSIQVADLSESENAIFFETVLIGPTEVDAGSEPSYPYIGVKLTYRDKPVQFR